MRPRFWVFNPPKSGGSSLATIYLNADGAAVMLPWSGDFGPIRGGWEKSAGASSAGYNFAYFDDVIINQLKYGAKKIAVILMPISFGGVNSFTPDYVFSSRWASTLGATTLHTCAGNDYKGSGAIFPGTSAQGLDPTAFPAAWEPPFKLAWMRAINAAIIHLAGSGYADKIAYVRIGGGAGGEWTPFATDTKTPGLLTVPNGPNTIGQLRTVWSGYYANVQQAALSALRQTSAVTRFQLGMSLNGGYMGQGIPYDFADDEALISNSNGVGMGNQGLQNADIGFFQIHGFIDGGSEVHGYPGANHAHLFDTYSSNPFKEFQTIAASDPTKGSIIPSAGTMGSLIPLLRYATYRKGTDFELYYQDWQVAFDQTYVLHAQYGIPYLNALKLAGMGA